MKFRHINRGIAAVALVCVAVGFSGCTLFGLKGSYSFTGASIPPGATTFSVAYIPNNTADFATLSNSLTEGLRDRFIRQTRLTQVPEDGDLAFEGEIVSVVEAPSAIAAAGADGRPEEASMMRVTVTVQIMFNNAIQPEFSFPNRQTFTAYTDFPGNQLRSSVENALVEELVEILVENIFNASVAQW
jgi:hypothetical protein